MRKRDLHREITDQLVATIERGDALPWIKPWTTSGASTLPVNAVTGKAYRGGNIVALWARSMAFGYTSNEWATFKQWQSLSTEADPVHVRKGEKATMGVFYKPFEKETQAPNGETKTDRWMMARAFYVFNRDQIEGLPAEAEPEPKSMLERIESFDRVVDATGAVIRFGGDRAFFSPSQDVIGMPKVEQFHDSASYYATLAHELTHWTGHKSRLDREFGRRFGDAKYAMEELVAEMGSAFALAEHGLSGHLQHANYLQSWLQVLKADARALFTAASKASEASDYIHGRTGANKATEAVAA